MIVMEAVKESTTRTLEVIEKYLKKMMKFEVWSIINQKTSNTRWKI
jgi:hypothetical protein